MILRQRHKQIAVKVCCMFALAYLSVASYNYSNYLESPTEIKKSSLIGEGVPTPIEVLQARKKLFQDTCTKYSHYFRPESFSLYGSDTKMTNMSTSFFKWKEKQYLMLTVLKGGSTSWKQYYYEYNMSSVNYCPECLASTHKIILQVRHPLERLVSTYRNLFEEQGWRRFLDEEFDNLGPGVEEFFLSINWVKFFTSIVLRHSFRRSLNLNVLYDDIDKVVFESIVMLHWAPYWFTTKFCLPIYSPDYIMHLETLDGDFLQVRNQTGLPPIKTKVVVMGEYNNDKRKELHSSNKVEEYYSQLTKQQVLAVYEMYKLDHELFGYTPDLYLQYAKD